MNPHRLRRWSWAVSGGLALIAASTSLAAGPKSGTNPAPAAVRLDYIDTMIRESWESASIKPSRPATDEEFLRRAYLDVLGRIPNIKEATSFLASGKDPGRRAKLVDYLLASPDYPKHFATLWKVTLLGRKRPDRDVDPDALTAWFRRGFAENRPWNEFARDLIVAEGSNKENGAVNFTLAHMDEGAVNLTSITTRVLLGQQIQCTQCHDHPSNDWKQADFWGINAFYKGLKKQDVMAADAAGTEKYDHTLLSDVPTDKFASFERRDARLGIAFPTFLDGRKISQDKDVNRRKALADFITEPKNEAFSKAFVNRMWGHFMGRGFVQPVDDFGDHNPPSHPELLDRLGQEFRDGGYDIKNLIRWIMNSEAYQLTSQATKDNEKDETLFSHMALKPMSPEQLFDSLIVATAAHKAGGGEDNTKRRDAWMGQFIFAFANDEGEEGSSFQGTIPQALMMMNGELMEKAVGGKNGSFLRDLLDRAQLQAKGSVEGYVVNALYMAALSRSPTRRELDTARAYLSNNYDTINVMEDMFWALLNSNEFVLNR
ncbi:DUF1553 domain-containing protein [Tundrisphaera sp. TA3]|uniref:DUF1553 domain-containing protein n=1 Tax=Tundrisphaera sp. TA3 TaxID=3435775 RepID=UPI003EB94AE9